MAEKEPLITPDEIRAIRQRLGLSQAEAGELIGGGPRAFTKYEAGTVSPTASAANLLRLLDTNPVAIATLQGSMARAIPAGSATPFDVSGEEIAGLTERTFTDLVRQLLNAEAQAHNLHSHGVWIHVPANIHTPDGGEDGRIQWEGGPDSTSRLPSRLNQFQLKAGKISPAGARRDVLTEGGAVKGMVRSVLEADGHYIMLCAYRYNQQAIESRVTNIRDALRSQGMSIHDEQIEFRDAEQIASWVNLHAAVATWVKERTQPGTTGPFRSWNYWADSPEHQRSPWVEDERLVPLRVRLLKQVTEPGTAVRIVGLSGVGKSRLTLEALGPTRGLLLNGIVMYTSQSEFSPGDISRVVQNLSGLGTRAIVVVDDCDADTHQVLAGMTLRQGSRLSLVTIDNEVPTETLDVNTVKIVESQPSVTEGILQNVSPGLAHEDQNRLERFSKGFPEIAVEIGTTWRESRPVAHASSDSFVDAYVLGRKPRNTELLMVSATLLATFGLVDMESPADGQLGQIASLRSGTNGEDIYSAVSQLVDRGVVRRRGRFVTLQPSPIAMRLAERQWKEWPPATWENVLSGDTSARLKVSAAKQLALLDTTEISKRVVAHVCRPQGAFEGLEGITQDGHAEVLSALSEIDPEVVVEQIERSLCGVEDSLMVGGNVRRHLVGALEKIAFHPQTFEAAAGLLLRLAVEEERRSRNSTDSRSAYINSNGDALGKFKELFTILLGSTEANGDSRLTFLVDAADTEESLQREVVAEALSTGCEMRHFSRVLGAEVQGSRSALRSWQPATQEQAIRYIDGCARQLIQLALKSDSAADLARTLLGRELGSLVLEGFTETVDTAVGLVGKRMDYWPEALVSLREVLAFNAEDIGPESTERVREWMASLQPHSLEARTRSLVTESSWSDSESRESDYDAQYRRRTEAVRELAADLLKQPTALSACLHQVSRGEQHMAFELGEDVAELANSPLGWLEATSQAVIGTPKDERNYDLLAGFVTGLAESCPGAVDEFKKKGARSHDLAPSLPQICWRLGITSHDIRLTIASLQERVLSPSRLHLWSFGGKLAEVSAQEIASLIDTLIDHSAEGFTEAVTLMGMYAFSDTDRLEGLRPQIVKLAATSARWKLTRRAHQYQHHFENVIQWMLGKGRRDADACNTVLALAKAVADVQDLNDDFLLKPMLPKLLSHFPEIAWPLIGQAIVSDPKRAWRLRYTLGDPHRSGRGTTPVLLSLPDSTLVAWCQANPGQAPAFMAGCVPVLATQAVDTTEPTLHPMMAWLLDEFGDRDDVQQSIESNIHTFSWSGSMTTYYESYRQPLANLLQHRKSKVRRWARTMLRQLENRLDEVRRQDEEMEAQWDT